jgi:Rieske Fe-S protein
MPDRRFLLKRAAQLLAATVVPPTAIAATAPAYIAKPAELNYPFDFQEFQYDSGAAILLRLPNDWREKELKTLKAGEKLRDNGVLEVMMLVQPWFFIAYWRTCPHEGCSVRPPDAQRELHCPCHGSVFAAQSGAVLSGPAHWPLRRLRLAYDGVGIYAIGTFRLGE